ncbi:hypothetical protein WN51_00905 [Melipona quadrifasciata]|uniref:Uncharacterized protein n=1 Tax=Melipona quadrifasciata TaxID=166423 RepID=A0A0N0U4L6_9HYME|nr:hypothetical protein WN51_00905 [Melipona quadrifasciata]
MYDSVQVFAVGLRTLEQSHALRPANISCEMEHPWDGGLSLINYINSLKTFAIGTEDASLPCWKIYCDLDSTSFTLKMLCSKFSGQTLNDYTRSRDRTFHVQQYLTQHAWNLNPLLGTTMMTSARVPPIDEYVDHVPVIFNSIPSNGEKRPTVCNTPTDRQALVRGFYECVFDTIDRLNLWLVRCVFEQRDCSLVLGSFRVAA